MAQPGHIAAQDIGNADHQPAIAFHSIAGVDRQIDDHLFQLSRIGPHEKQPRRRDNIQLDGWAKQFGQQRPQPLHQFTHTQQLPVLRLLAGKGQQLRHQIGAALAVV